MLLIEAAVEAHIRPTAMILGTQPNKKWNKYDRLLLEARQILLRERCPQCGLPKWICHNEDGDVDVNLTRDVCYVKREIDAEDEKTTKREAGVSLTPNPRRYSGKPFDWEFREAYYKLNVS